jgi:pimeloyl-ACP methyl ester carboxylesterase
MSRLPLTFRCNDLRLAATLDTAPGTAGLLIVSGGNEIRAGAFGGQAELAAHIARAGFPVFRFDRRGVGDSEGENRGFRRSAKDIAAAIEAFRAIAPQIERVIAFGNCDAASALMLMGGAGCNGLVLSNPWTIEEGADGISDASTLPLTRSARAMPISSKTPARWRGCSAAVSISESSRADWCIRCAASRHHRASRKRCARAWPTLPGKCESYSPRQTARHRFSRALGTRLTRVSAGAKAQATPMSSPHTATG